MKTLIMSLVIAAAGLSNTAFAGNAAQQRFAYNTEETGNAEIQYVYKVSADGQYEILRWDDASAKYCPVYALRYAYEGGAVTVECARWSVEDQAYTDVREKAVYAPDAYGLTYQAYEYDAESGAWQLTGEHGVDAALLAGR